MNTTVERLEGNQVKLTMIVPAEEVDARIKATYREIAQKNRFPGFRKGRAPRKVIDSYVGREYVLGSTTETLVNELFPQAMDAEDLRPIKDADFGDAEIMIEEGKDFELSAIILNTPELELDSYEPVEIELPAEEATEAEVDDQIAAIAEYYFELNEVSGRGAQKGDLVTIDIKTTYDGKEIPSYTNTARTYELGGAAMPAEIDDQIVDMKVGDDKEFEFDAPADSLASVNGKEGDKFQAKVALRELREKSYPTIDDAFAKDRAGFDSLEEMRANIAEGITAEKTRVMPRLKEQRCGNALTARLQGEAPEEMIAQTQQDLLRDFFTDLQRQGITFDAYLKNNGLTADAFQEDVKKQAADITNESLALDALARHLGLEATDEDIDAEFEKAGVDDPAATRKEWEAAGRLSMIREGIRRGKASEWLLDNAVVTEEAEEKAEEKAEDAE